MARGNNIEPCMGGVPTISWADGYVKVEDLENSPHTPGLVVNLAPINVVRTVAEAFKTDYEPFGLSAAFYG